jgi:hypothetical protein
MTNGDEPADEDRPLWDLSRAEQRILWITFVGGLASVVIGVGVVGGALALARAVSRFESTWGLLLLLTAGQLALSFGLIRILRPEVIRAAPIPFREGRSAAPRAWRAAVAEMIVAWSVLILAWIGLADGVK